MGEENRRREWREQEHAKQVESEKQGLTFQPVVNESCLKHGRINVQQDPEGYMQMIKEKQAAKVAAQEMNRKQREDAELALCTFKPVLKTKCPAYHKRLALERRKVIQPPRKVKPAWQ